MKKIRPRKGSPFKIDLACGAHKFEDFIGVDIHDFPGVDYVWDLTKTPWPIDSLTVDEIRISHFVEHLDNLERVRLVNELHRVMKKGAKCAIISPHWSSARAYGDPTHKWPPLGEFWFFYLSKTWRMEHAPATDKENWPDGFSCNFEVTWGYGLSPAILQRSQEFQQFAVNFYREAAVDLHGMLTKL